MQREGEFVVLGVIIGVATGIAQYFLLLKFTSAVSGGRFSKKTVLFAITQFLLPFAVLLLSAFFLGEDILGKNFLMWIGIGIAAALITCAVVKFLVLSKATKK